MSKLRWHLWHKNTEKSWDKLRRILTLCRIVSPRRLPSATGLRYLDYRVQQFFDYPHNNKGTLLDYGKRYRAGKPISTAMAESAINQGGQRAHVQAPADALVAAKERTCLASRLRRWSPPP